MSSSIATPALCPLDTAGEPRSSRLRVVRKPTLRVRQAVRDNNVALLARLQHKCDLRNMDKERLTSLAWAALELNIEVFEWLLLDYGHDDSELSRDADNNNIFHFLAAAPAPPGLSPFTDLLLSDALFPPRPRTRSQAEAIDISLRMTEVYYTLFPFIVDWSNSSGKTALHYAAQVDNAPFIDLFCELGADVNLADLQGNTPLHYASAWGNMESVRVLFERGAQPSLRNLEGFTPADYAYSISARAQLEAIAKEVAEERRARRKEEKRIEKEAREREARELEAAQEEWERQQAERELQRELDLERDRELERQRVSERNRSNSSSTGYASTSDFARVSEPEEMPPFPNDVVAAGQAAAAARYERRGSDRSMAERRTPIPSPIPVRANSSRSSPRSYSPTPQASRQHSLGYAPGVPALALVTPTPTHPAPGATILPSADRAQFLPTLEDAVPSPSPSPSPLPGSRQSQRGQRPSTPSPSTSSRPTTARSPSLPAHPISYATHPYPHQAQPPAVHHAESTQNHAL